MQLHCSVTGRPVYVCCNYNAMLKKQQVYQTCMLSLQYSYVAGRREWAPIQKWCHKHMETALKAWFGNVEVVREGTTPLDPEDKYIFGYTPHGLFPIGMQAFQAAATLASLCVGAALSVLPG